jgi:Protein of unknown function (DUF3987)
MFANIPAELQALRQWVCHAKKRTPYQTNWELASVTDAATWNSFSAVCDACARDARFEGIGFVFTEHDAYAGVDLDHSDDPKIRAKHEVIYNKLNSYSELSPSGNGVHIIVKGKVPSGARANKVEIYSSGRYFTFTGNTWIVKPIQERQAELMELWNELKPTSPNTPNTQTFEGDPDEKYTDEEIHKIALEASNGAKYSDLFAGNWHSYYPSQSEADLALVNIIAFYTQNRRQLIRLFHRSELGKRPKAKRKDYLLWMINKAFDQMPTLIDIDGFKEALEAKLAKGSVAQVVEPAAHNGLVAGSNPAASTIPVTMPSPLAVMPPGLIGDLARYIYAASAHPVWEVSLAGAIGWMAGVCGKAYTFNGDLLNLFVLIVGSTGVGKEAPRKAISTLIQKIDGTLLVPLALPFFGPQKIASGQALGNFVRENQSFVSFVGEFGLRIQEICDPRATSSERNLYSTLLDLFSVGTGIMGDAIYSDKSKSLASVSGVAMSMLGDTTPETFYSMVDEHMIATGLLPRFLLFEYNGKREYFNRNKIDNPPEELVTRFKDLINSVKIKIHTKTPFKVGIDDKARELLYSIGDNATDKINDTSSEMHRSLWTRAHQKIHRLAALVAIGINPHFPSIDCGCIEWAAHIVYHDIEMLLRKFEKGEVGPNNSERKQLDDIKRCIVEFVTKDWSEIKGYCLDSEIYHRDKIMPSQYLSTRVSRLISFKNDKLGPTKALDRAIKMATDLGWISIFSNVKKYNTTRKLFVVSPEILDQ